MTLPPVIAVRVKAFAALVVSGVVSYVAAAVIAGQALTLHGLEVAAITAAAAFVGVHQAPANRAQRAKARQHG